jgi:hypothetical protein
MQKQVQFGNGAHRDYLFLSAFFSVFELWFFGHPEQASASALRIYLTPPSPLFNGMT